MFSVEQTIISFIEFLKKLIFTLYSLIFRPNEFLRQRHSADNSRYSKHSVFFIISLFTLYCFNLNLRHGWTIKPYFEVNYFLKDVYERIFTFPTLGEIFMLLATAGVSYIFLMLISHLLRLKGLNGSLFISFTMYYISLMILFWIFSQLFFIYGFTLSGYFDGIYIGVRTLNILSLIILSVPIVIASIALIKRFYKYNKKIFFKFSTSLILLFCCLDGYYQLYESLNPIFGKKIKEEVVYVSSLNNFSREVYIPIYVSINENNSRELHTIIKIENYSQNEILFYKDKCMALRVEELGEFICHISCSCKQIIQFYVDPKLFDQTILIKIEPNETIALPIYAHADSTVLMRYVKKDSIFQAYLDFSQEVPYGFIEGYKFPKIKNPKWKFVNK